MLCFTHRKDTVNSCVSIIALKGNEFKAFCIIKYDRLEKPLRQRCPHSAYEHRTDSHHIRIATFHSEMWLRAPERLVPPVSDIVAVPQNISQLASLLLAGRSANFLFSFLQLAEFKEMNLCKHATYSHWDVLIYSIQERASAISLNKCSHILNCQTYCAADVKASRPPRRCTVSFLVGSRTLLILISFMS